MRPACGSFTREDTYGFAQVREGHNGSCFAYSPDTCTPDNYVRYVRRPETRVCTYTVRLTDGLSRRCGFIGGLYIRRTHERMIGKQKIRVSDRSKIIPLRENYHGWLIVRNDKICFTDFFFSSFWWIVALRCTWYLALWFLRNGAINIII